MSTEMLLEQISSARAKLEKRFADYETALSKRQFLVQDLLLSSRQTEVDESPPPDPETSKEETSDLPSPTVSQLEEENSALKKQVETLETNLQSLRESLKIMAQDRRDLINKMDKGSLEQEQTMGQSSLQFQTELMQLRKRREKSLVFWSHLAKRYRQLKKGARAVQNEKDALARKVSALIVEQDTAFELIAELRDELRAQK